MSQPFYIDSSVVLRHILAQAGRWEGLLTRGTFVSSRLLEVECLRVLDRLRLTGQLMDQELANSIQYLRELQSLISLYEISPSVLKRATQSLPVVLGTLDAIHLATALVWQEIERMNLILVSHDSQLKLAAQSQFIVVEG